MLIGIVRKVPAPQRVELPALTLRADIVASTVDAERRTAEVVWTTGARTLRRDLFDTYHEELSVDPKHVRMARLASGRAPVLAVHNGLSLNAVIGVVETARLERGQGIATVRFAKDDEAADAVWNKIEQGILRNISVGYKVHKYEKRAPLDEVPVLRAMDWEPFELSVVPMGVDADARVRADETTLTNTCVIVSAQKETRAMADESRPPIATEIIEVDPHDPGAPAEPTQVRAAEPVPPSDRDAGAAAERLRSEGITRAVRAARLPTSMSDRLIHDGVPLVDAQDQVLRALEEQDRGGPRVTQVRVESVDPNVNVWRGIENALLHRVSPTLFQLDESGRPYRGLSLMEVGKICLQARGVRTTGMSKMEVAGLALGLDTRAGYHTTSDFPNILADVANKTLRRAYEEAPATFTPFSRRVTLPDFKLAKRLQLGEAPALLAVNEHGEFTHGTIGEGKEQFQLSTYGRIFAITRKALVNDDTDSFSRITQLFGRAARDLESNLVWAQITANAAMGDGVALFHATHNNLSATSDAIAIASIGAGRAGMRNQKGLDGVTFVNVNPRFLLVPVGKETLADQFVSTNLMASASTSVNPFAGRLQVIAEPRLDANSAVSWYLAGSPEQIDIVEYAFLEGEEGPSVESRIGFDIDGLEIKCRHDFAAKVIDWRGLWKNPGA